MKTTLGLLSCLSLWTSLLLQQIAATPIIYDGRALFSLTNIDLDNSVGPFLTVVKGSENTTHYSRLLNLTHAPTPLWARFGGLLPTEQTISMTIDNTSVFVPGSPPNLQPPQFGFRRGEFIAQVNGDHDAFNAASEVGVRVYHFSIQKDERRPLNLKHEYQIVFIEPSDGSHIFDVQLGSPFTDPTGPLPAPDALTFKVRDHAGNVLFSTPFAPRTWHNFAVQVDWDKRTLGVFFSRNDERLRAVTALVQNPTVPAGAAGQGDFHFGVLKLPLVNREDSPENQGDVVHFGVQEGTVEGLFYSGVFIEETMGGVSTGNGGVVGAIS